MQKGYRRERGEGPNYSAFAGAIGVHTSTVMNALRGGPRKADASTIRKIVKELGDDTAAWFDLQKVEPWEPPASAALLTDRQRKALTELIDSMTERHRDDNAAAITHAGDAREEVPDYRGLDLAASDHRKVDPSETMDSNLRDDE